MEIGSKLWMFSTDLYGKWSRIIDVSCNSLLCIYFLRELYEYSEMVISPVSKNKSNRAVQLSLHKAFLPRSEGEVRDKIKVTPESDLPRDLFCVLKGQSLCGTNLINWSQKYCIQFPRKHSRMPELGFCYTENANWFVMFCLIIMRVARLQLNQWVLCPFSKRRKVI